MGLLGVVLFGALVGVVADLIDTRHNNKLWLDVVLGIVGAVLGGFLRQIFTSNDAGAAGALHWDLWSFVWALIGTPIVLWIYHASLPYRSRR